MKHQYATIIVATTVAHLLSGCAGSDDTHIDQYGTLVNSVTGEPTDTCGSPSDGVLGDVEDIADSGLGLTGQITKYLGFRNGAASQAAECWNSSTQQHDCNVLGDMLIKYVWTPAPGFVDTNPFYQIRVGLLNALGDLNTYSGASGPKFTHLSGDKNMPIKYGFNTSPCTPTDCSQSSAGFTSMRIDGASPQTVPSSFAPVRAFYKPAGYSSDFNLTRLVALTKTCFNTNTPTDSMYNAAGKAFGLHEFMHVKGWAHVTSVTPDIMNSTLSCAQVTGGAGSTPSLTQRNAMAAFRAGTWTNGVLLAPNPALDF